MVLLCKATDEKWILIKESLTSKSSIKNRFRQLPHQMLVESIQSFPLTWKWRIWKGHGCHPVGLFTYHPVQPHNTLVLRTWSFGQPNQCKCSNLETQKKDTSYGPLTGRGCQLWNSNSKFLQEHTGDLFFTSTQSPSGEHSCPALTSLRFWSRPFDQIFYYALLALRRRCAAKGINF